MGQLFSMPVTVRLHPWFLDYMIMDQRTVKDIKRIYRSAKKEMVFRPIFERKLATYIRRRAPENSVNWHKLRYEFRTIYRKCRDQEYALKDYLKYMATFTEIAAKGNHKKVEIDPQSLKPQRH
jgi:hypothetical protein